MSQNTELKAQTKKPGLNKKGIAAWINNYSFILIALAIFIAYLFINHGATTWSGVMNILRHSAVVGIMAFGMGLVIITGGIDLSVGSMLALVGSFSVVVFNATDSVFLTLLFALVAGGLCGLFNGVLIGLVKMPAFIVTLATMLIFRSVAQYYLRTTGSSIFNMTGTLDHYASFYGFGQLKIATVPVVGIVLLVVTVIMVFISTCTKFGKTEQGNVWLDPERTSPYRFYQFWLNVADDEAEKYLKIFTFLSQEEIAALAAEHAADPGRRPLQRKLAEELTVLVHGREAYEAAVEASQLLFSPNAAELLHKVDEATLLDILDGVPTFEVDAADIDAGVPLLELLAVRTKVFPSKGEARKMTQQGAVSINKAKVTDPQAVIGADSLLQGKYILVQRGKKNQFLIKTKQ